MNDLADFPTIETVPMPAHVTEVLDAAPAKATAETAVALMRRSTLAELTAVERGIAKLKADHGATDYDITTPKGLQLAKDRRLAVREVRYQIPHTVKARKAELKEVGEALDTEAERITAELLAIEKPHDDKIKAREKELADEKAERERIAAEKAQKQADGVASIRAYLSRAQTAADMTAERVGKGIELLEAMTFAADEWLDPVAAASAQCETLEGMRVLQATLKAREEAAAAAEAQRLENERVAADLAAAQARLLAEQQRIARLQAMVAEIRAAATGHDNASAADLSEAIVAVKALDVSEAVYFEFAALAQAAQASTLAVLAGLHIEAEARELAAVRATLAPAPAPYTPPPFGGYAGHPIYNPENPPPEFTEGQDDQQVLKAEPATADATDRSVPADISPCGGTMGAGQPAAAGPADEFVLVVPAESTVYAQLSAPAAVEPGVTLIRGEVGTIDAGITIGEPPAMTHAAFLALVMSAFDCKFPSHPKPSAAWWAEVRAAGQQLQGLAA